MHPAGIVELSTSLNWPGKGANVTSEGREVTQCGVIPYGMRVPVVVSQLQTAILCLLSQKCERDRELREDSASHGKEPNLPGY